MKRIALRLIVSMMTVAAIAGIPVTVNAVPPVVYVDDSASPGGDGSTGHPAQTIGKGIGLLPITGGTVAIHPGTYLGPIRIDRDGVVLRGLTEPLYDAEGFLAGFTSDDPDDDEVVITIDPPPDEGDPAPGDPADLIALHGSDNEVHNLVIDSRRVPITASLAAFSAEAKDDEFYDSIVFSHIIVRGSVELGGYCAKANAQFEYITSLDPGFVGIWVGANGNVEVHNVHIARKAANVVFAALDESPKEENGPSVLTGLLKNSKLASANGVWGFFTDGSGLLVIGRKNAVNPAESSTIFLEFEGNDFQDNRSGVTIWPVHGTKGFSTESTLLQLDFHDNTYINNHLLNVDVSFQTPPFTGSVFAANSTVIVQDADGAFPDPSEVSLGPVENGNTYMLLP